MKLLVIAIIPLSKQCVVPPPQIWLAGNTGRVISLFCQTPFNAREVARRGSTGSEQSDSWHISTETLKPLHITFGQNEKLGLKA